MTTPPLIDQAHAARQAGQDAEAERLCRALLASDSDHRGAQSLLGLCRAEAGDHDGGAPMVEAAVAAEPDNWRLHLNLSALREIEGDLDAAAAAAATATALAPDRFEPWGRLGDLEGRRGDFAAAVAALDKAAALDPQHPGVAMLLAAAAMATGDLAKAEALLPGLERAAPGHPQLLPLRTHLARRRGDIPAFTAAAAAWLKAEPGSVAARVAAAHSCSLREDYPGAVALMRPLAEGDPAHPDHAATLARYLLWARDFAGAEAEYQRALSLSPAHAAAAAGLARLAIFRGDMAQAADLAARAVAADPADPDGYSQLALATGGLLSDAALDRLHGIAADPSADGDSRAVAWFTIGDVLHKRRAHDAAFDAWTEGNALRQAAAARAGAAYDAKATAGMADRVIALFSTLPPPRQVPDKGTPTPLFIIGMPRSGTTLLDSALAGHGRIVSGGELPFMPAALNAFLGWADKAGWRGGAIPEPVAAQMRARYLAQYATYGIADAAFITDKQPINFWSVGLIRHLFPAAPIIHIRRDPLETGFSIFRNNFTRSWPFTTAMADIGHYHGQYARLMRHWGSIADDRMAETSHAALVMDFEGELRRLLTVIGLPWDDACLAYPENGGIVTTLSAAQVRQGPTAALLSSTPPYAHRLGPLRDALIEAGVPL